MAVFQLTISLRMTVEVALHVKRREGARLTIPLVPLWLGNSPQARIKLLHRTTVPDTANIAAIRVTSLKLCK